MSRPDIMARLGSRGRVYAFEAPPAAFDELSSTLISLAWRALGS